MNSDFLFHFCMLNTSFVNNTEVTSTLDEAIKQQKLSSEAVIPIVFQSHATFRVRAVTRCTGTIPGLGKVCVEVSVCGKEGTECVWKGRHRCV